MFCLAGRAGENHVRYPQQSAESAAMKLLRDIVLVPDRPEGPNLVKHDHENALRMLFPIEQPIDEPARIAKPTEAVPAVLNEHLPAGSW